MSKLLSFLLILGFSPSLFAQDTIKLSVYFDTDSYILSPKEQENIVSNVEILSATINSIQLYGYCDDRGSKNYNLKLAQNRINSVLQSIEKIDFNGPIESQAIGEIQLNTRDSSGQRKQNRRVDVIIDIRSVKNNIEEIVFEPEEPEPQEQTITEELKVGDKIVLQNILFQGGRHHILKESVGALDELVNSLKEHDQYEIKILGHICCLPPGNDGEDFDTGEFNLSVARAEMIYNYLIKNGIDASRLSYEGLGSNFPTGKEAKYDRRVEIEITTVRTE